MPYYFQLQINGTLLKDSFLPYLRRVWLLDENLHLSGHPCAQV
jgi:hypothetical protein